MPHITPVHHRPILYGIEPAGIPVGHVKHHGVEYNALVMHITKSLAFALFSTQSSFFARALKSNIVEPTAIAHRAIANGVAMNEIIARAYFPTISPTLTYSDPGV